ncbi:MAG: hypothetical protein KBS93_09620 [Flavobacteriaceae bacterium]|nr:hypothetical protein [Candidatus Onthonaster equi]
MKKIFYLAIAFIALASCQTQQDKEQNLEQLDKSSAREVVLSSQTIGDTLYHITTQKIWSNSQLISEKIDTLKVAKQPSDSIKTPIYVTIQ